eukprot:35796_1
MIGLQIQVKKKKYLGTFLGNQITNDNEYESDESEEFPNDDNDDEYESDEYESDESDEFSNDDNDDNNAYDTGGFSGIVSEIRETRNGDILFTKLDELLENINETEYHTIGKRINSFGACLLGGGTVIVDFLETLGYKKSGYTFILKEIDYEKVKYAKYALKNRTAAFCNCKPICNMTIGQLRLKLLKVSEDYETLKKIQDEKISLSQLKKKLKALNEDINICCASNSDCSCKSSGIDCKDRCGCFEAKNKSCQNNGQKTVRKRRKGHYKTVNNKWNKMYPSPKDKGKKKGDAKICSCKGLLHLSTTAEIVKEHDWDLDDDLLYCDECGQGVKVNSTERMYHCPQYTAHDNGEVQTFCIECMNE